MPVPVRPNVPQQCRELQNALDAERQKNKELQGELLKTKNELYGVKSESKCHISLVRSLDMFLFFIIVLFEPDIIFYYCHIDILYTMLILHI